MANTMLPTPSNGTIAAVPVSTVDRETAARPLGGSKRKQQEGADDDDDEDDGSDVSMINVDFDFYNPNPDVDDIALKRLLHQLLHTDSQLVDVHALATHILAEAALTGVGSTVKVDGEESDPYAYLSVVDLSRRQNEQVPAPIRQLMEYLLSQIPSTSSTTDEPSLHALLSSTLETPAAPASPRIALVVSERLVNLPVQLMPPMWKMMVDEVAQKGLEFTHYLLLGRVYRIEGDDGEDWEETTETRPSKKTKKAPKEAATAGVFHYHPEEEFLERLASHVHTFSFRTAEPRNEESFGVEQRARVALYEADKLPAGIKLMEEGCT